MKKALITGVTGQDGAYLAEFLLGKGYEVHGIKRRASLFNTDRIDHLYQDPHESDRRFVLHYGDLTDATNLIRIIQEVQPDEIYNLGAQSHVAVSFETPEYTANSDALGTLRLLEAVRILGLDKKTRLPLPRCTAKSRKFHRRKKRHFIRVHLMVLQNCMHTGSASIIVKPTVFMPAVAFCLTMNHRCVERHLFPARLREDLHE